MPSFTNADGTTVDGFLPGYAIDIEQSKPVGMHWLQVQVDGIEFWFMPRERLRPELTYAVDQRSGYTLSIRPAD
jgi:hypothetical protein